MESPKYDFIAQNLSSTRVLLHKMEQNMRTQLEKPHKMDNFSKNYDFLDNLTTKRRKSASKTHGKAYKNENELEQELEILRKRLNSGDFREESADFQRNFEISKEKSRFSDKKSELSAENLDFFPTKGEDLTDENRKKKSFNAMKYEVEIKLLRNELEKVKKTKETLENELKSLKFCIKSKKKALK